MNIRKIGTFLLLALFSLYYPLQGTLWDDITRCFIPGQRSPNPTIRVLVLHDVETAYLQVDGKYSLHDPYENSHLSSRFCGKGRTIQVLSDGLKWGEAFPGLHQLQICPKHYTTQIILNDQVYNNPLYIYEIEKGATLSAVVDVPIEDYVGSLLSTYQNVSLEKEVLAALAIVIRTNAYYEAFHPKTTYWAVDGQVTRYPGAVSLFPQEEEALHQTRHMIMSKTSIYEGVATPFAAQFDAKDRGARNVETAKISLEEANAMAQGGAHAAQILAKAFPQATIMLIDQSKNH